MTAPTNKLDVGAMIQTNQVLDLVNDCSGKDGLVDVRALVNELLSAGKPAVMTDDERRAEISRLAATLPETQEEYVQQVKDAMLAASPAAQLRDAQDERTDALCDSSYCAGLQQGFTFGQQDDNEGLHKALAARDGYVKVLREAPAPAQSGHPDDLAVDQFAAAMKEKLAQARAKGRGGWQRCDPTRLSNMLRKHVEKGDPRDVANFCMFLWHLEQPIAPQPSPTAVGLDDERAPVIGLLKRARYVRHEDLPADVRDETETRAAYGNSAAWQDARNHEQRRLIDEALSRLEVLATSPQSGQTEQALKAQLNAAYAALDAVADWAKQEGADDDMEAGTRLLALLLKHGVHPRETLAVQPASGGAQ
jgi:hypothetical protein